LFQSVIQPLSFAVTGVWLPRASLQLWLLSKFKFPFWRSCN